MVVVWLVLGIVLLWVELHTVSFFAGFGALGAFGAAVTALVAPSALALQVVVLLAVATVGVLALRPMVSRAFEHRRSMTSVARGVHGGIVGHEALTLDDVGDETHRGHVRLVGETWLAASATGPIGAGTRVMVRRVEGTTLIVEGLPREPQLRADRPLHGRDNA